MSDVVNSGLGTAGSGRLNLPGGELMAGKTGTAQVRRISTADAQPPGSPVPKACRGKYARPRPVPGLLRRSARRATSPASGGRSNIWPCMVPPRRTDRARHDHFPVRPPARGGPARHPRSRLGADDIDRQRMAKKRTAWRTGRDRNDPVAPSAASDRQAPPPATEPSQPAPPPLPAPRKATGTRGPKPMNLEPRLMRGAIRSSPRRLLPASPGDHPGAGPRNRRVRPGRALSSGGRRQHCSPGRCRKASASSCSSPWQSASAGWARRRAEARAWPGRPMPSWSPCCCSSSLFGLVWRAAAGAGSISVSSDCSRPS